MRRILGVMFFVTVLLIGGFAVALFLVPPEVYQQAIEQQASQATGREVKINGPVKISAFPKILARASNVSISNPVGFSDAAFAQMDELRVGVKFLPLFSKRVEITEFVLVRPQIFLEKRKNNSVNWAMEAQQKFIRQPGLLPVQASFGKLRIIDGQARYLDHTTNTKTQINVINMRLSLPDLNKEMRLSGEAELTDTLYSVSLRLASLRDFLDGKRTSFSTTIDSELLQASFDGAFAASQDIAFTGKMDVTLPSVQKLTETLGDGFTAQPNTFGLFSISGNVKGDSNRLRFENAKIKFDQIAGDGNFLILLTGAKAKLTGNLQIDQLNINPYLPPIAEAEAQSSSWSQDPFSLEVLQQANVNFTLGIGNMQARNLQFGRTAMKVSLVDGRMQADLTEFNIYQGTGTGRAVINSRGAIPSFSLSANIEKAQALPLLTAIAEVQNLEGVGAFDLDILASGNSIDALMHSLSGTANMQVADGAITGVNLASVLRSAQSFLLTGKISADNQAVATTDFSTLQGSFVIANGIARNSDMLMLGPLLRVTGKGEINLGQQTLDYHLNPKAVASLKGQGGIADLQGISAPFRIHGPWNNLQAGLDTQALQQKALDQAKQEASKLITDNIGGEIGGLLKGFLGTDEKQQTQTPPDQPREKTDEEKALEILGGFFGLTKPETPVENQPEADPQ